MRPKSASSYHDSEEIHSDESDTPVPTNIVLSKKKKKSGIKEKVS